jgi:hypothetical protein
MNASGERRSALKEIALKIHQHRRGADALEELVRIADDFGLRLVDAEWMASTLMGYRYLRFFPELPGAIALLKDEEGSENARLVALLKPTRNGFFYGEVIGVEGNHDLAAIELRDLVKKSA